jgi:hypothetical protein
VTVRLFRMGGFIDHPLISWDTYANCSYCQHHPTSR